MAVTIHGAGCALMDYLYRDVDFASDAVRALLRRKPGDGGLNIGGLVFAEALERFAGRPIDEVLRSITGGRAPDRQNVGGPAIVSLIHTAQLLPEATVRFFGATGDDETGAALRSIASKTPLRIDDLATRAGATPATYVFSDPSYADGHGERMFVNQLGVASHVAPSDLGPEFPRADIVQLGGTALVPTLHDSLETLLRDARSAGALTVVNTVYDFRSELAHPDERWPLGGDGAYRLIDLLVTDAEEAARLSGAATTAAAIDWFLARGAGAAIVTNGPQPVSFAAAGPRFARAATTARAVFTGFARSRAAREGDTTGCGDTFTGGVIASLADQMESLRARPRAEATAATAPDGRLDLEAAVVRGIASGAFCLTHLGGTFIEADAGEKLRRVREVEELYLGSGAGS
ncbi:MAG: carbohydrate kinase family protein [Spirochaetota bacterium]